MLSGTADCSRSGKDDQRAGRSVHSVPARKRKRTRRLTTKRVISSVANCLNPYEAADFDAMMEVAASDDLEIIVSNTTEAGIQYDPSCQQDD